MKNFRTSIFVAAAVSVSACASVETASRNAPYTPTSELSAAQTATRTAQLRITSFTVSVPETLSVSEANAYYPKGDIVWRGDPMGNRHEQVAAIFNESLNQSVATTTEGHPVTVDIEVKRFHALTEKARYTVGGVHAITFVMQIRDAKTKELLTQPRLVEADLQGFGGDDAIAAEAQGLTQKVRIKAHLVDVLREEMTSNRGYVNRKLGFIQAVNKL